MNINNPRGRALSPQTVLLIRVAFLLVAIFQFSAYFVARPFSMHGVDYTVLWRAAHQLVHGQGVYDHPPILIGNDHWEVFKYPQFTAFAFSWLGWIRGFAGEVVWKVLMLTCLGGAIAMMFPWRRLLTDIPSGSAGPPRPDGGRDLVARNLPLIAALLLSVFSPASWALSIGQIGPLILLLATCLTWALLARRDGVAGVFWALLCLIKVSPVLLAVYFLIFRRRRVLAMGGVVFAGYAALLAISGRIGDELRYVREIVPEIPYLARVVSYSVSRWITLGFFPAAEANAEWFLSIQRNASLAGTGIYAATAVALKRSGASLADALPTAILGLMLVSPVLEGHHFVLIWPALILHLTLWNRGRVTDAAIAMAMIAWGCILATTTFHQLGTSEAGRFVPTGANIALWCTSVWAAARTRRTCQVAADCDQNAPGGH
jgi:alpha-1,2-mannosyltransferase